MLGVMYTLFLFIKLNLVLGRLFMIKFIMKIILATLIFLVPACVENILIIFIK